MEEINALRTALEKPERPTAAVVGGAKVSTKIPVLTNLVAKVDKLIIGGGMANTFLQAMGTMVGKSLAEPEFHATARDIIAEAKKKGCEIILPVDAVIAREFKEGAASEVVDIDHVPFDAMILDVGPQSVAHVVKVLEGAKTLLWNGPMGAFEIAPFGEGTFALARAAAALTKAGRLVSVAGGGDTVAAFECRRSDGRFHLCLDGGRRLSRMARGARAAGYRGPRALRVRRAEAKGAERSQEQSGRMFADAHIYLGVALAGLASFLSPCVLPLVLPYLGYIGGTTFDQLTGEEAVDRRAWARVVASAVFFVLGFTTVFVCLGAGASTIGQVMLSYRATLGTLAGVVIVLFGLHFLGRAAHPYSPPRSPLFSGNRRGELRQRLRHGPRLRIRLDAMHRAGAGDGADARGKRDEPLVRRQAAPCLFARTWFAVYPCRSRDPAAS